MIGQRLPSPISFLPIAAAIEKSGLINGYVNLSSSILEGVVMFCAAILGCVLVLARKKKDFESSIYVNKDRQKV